MLVFIDESGDTGLKILHGSSKFFVVTTVVFPDVSEAQKCDTLIELLKTTLKIKKNSEFKFSKIKRDKRIQFIQTVLKTKFYYFAVVINKDTKKLYGNGFKVKESFYKYACSLVIENSKKYLKNATVVIDGSGSREFKQQLNVYLRKKAGAGIIKKVKVQDSRKNNLIQLADFVAGSIHRSFSEKDDKDIYRKILREREKKVQTWPK